MDRTDTFGPTQDGPSIPHIQATKRGLADDASVALLLTGATGFVGGQLLLRLLKQDRRKIICLIRARDAADAQRRGDTTLSELLGREPYPTERHRIEWLRADLEDRRLGLRQKTWSSLAQQVTEIFHCAASVDFDLPLEDAHRINVQGVAHLLELAESAGSTFRRLHHVSTAYVAGRTTGKVKAGFIPVDRASHFRNTYERTKARAERLLQSQTQVPVTIYRPSIIGGDTRTGRTTNWNVVYVPMRKIVKGQLPFIRSGGRALVDTVGVDFVVDGILALAKRPAPHGATYHLTAGARAFDIHQYAAACGRGAKRAGKQVKSGTVSPFSWWLRTRSLGLLARSPSDLLGLRKIGQAAVKGLQTFRPYTSYTSVSVEFDTELEHRWLEERGIVAPEPLAYLDRIIDYAIRHDFGRVSDPAAEPLRRERPAPTFREEARWLQPTA